MHKLIPLDAQDEWKSALTGIKHTFAHTWEHCFAMHLTTGLKTFLYHYEKNGTRIVCPICEREFSGYTDIVKPFGIAGFVGNGECPDFSNHWNTFVLDRGYVCGYLGLNPVFDLSHLFDPSEISHYNNIFLMDLRLPLRDIVSGMSENRRRQVNNGSLKDITFVYDKHVLAKFFLEHYESYMQRQGAAAFYFLTRDTLRHMIGLDNVLLTGIRQNGKIMAATMMTYTEDLGDGMFYIAAPDSRNFSALLIWEGIKRLKSLGVPAKNLGGGRPGSGFADFKRRFGGRVYPLKSLRQIYRPEIYKKLCALSNVDVTDKSGFFPAYRQ